MYLNKDAITNPGAIIIEGHTQGLSNTRSLGEIGIPIIVVDKSNCIARYSKYCLKFFQCPDFIKDDFAEFLIDIAVKNNIKNWILVPSNDHAVYTISRNRSRLDPYYKFLIPPENSIDTIYDKSRLISLAERSNISVPKTQCFSTVDDKLNEEMIFPLITKGRNSLSFYKIFSKKVFIANTEEELREQFEIISKSFDIKGTFTQELIPFHGENRTISFTAFCVDGEIKTNWMGVKLREHPFRFGTATLAESIYVPECLIQSKILIKALNYSGICEVEFLYDPRSNQYKLIEINARSWLWVGLAKACGIDYMKILNAYLNNQEVIYPENYKIGLKWINYLTDSYIALKAILKGQMKITEYVISLRGPKVSAIHSWRDLKPSIMFLFLALSLANKRNFLT